MDERELRLEAAKTIHDAYAEGLEALAKMFEALADDANKQVMEVMSGIRQGKDTQQCKTEAAPLLAQGAAYRNCTDQVRNFANIFKERLGDPIEITKREALLNQSRGETKRQ